MYRKVVKCNAMARQSPHVRRNIKMLPVIPALEERGAMAYKVDVLAEFLRTFLRSKLLP